MLKIIDTHTHFDVPEFDIDRAEQCTLAYDNGIRHLILIGFLAKLFNQMVNCQNQIQKFIANKQKSPTAHLAFGLHPFYITQHTDNDLILLENFIKNHKSVAIGEIGLDTFTDEMKTAKKLRQTTRFFYQTIGFGKKLQFTSLATHS